MAAKTVQASTWRHTRGNYECRARFSESVRRAVIMFYLMDAFFYISFSLVGFEFTLYSVLSFLQHLLQSRFENSFNRLPFGTISALKYNMYNHETYKYVSITWNLCHKLTIYSGLKFLFLFNTSITGKVAILGFESGSFDEFDLLNPDEMIILNFDLELFTFHESRRAKFRLKLSFYTHYPYCIMYNVYWGIWILIILSLFYLLEVVHTYRHNSCVLHVLIRKIF